MPPGADEIGGGGGGSAGADSEQERIINSNPGVALKIPHTFFFLSMFLV